MTDEQVWLITGAGRGLGGGGSADAVEMFETKARTLLAQADAHRGSPAAWLMSCPDLETVETTVRPSERPRLETLRVKLPYPKAYARIKDV